MSGVMAIMGIVMMTAMLAAIGWGAIAALRGRRRRTPDPAGARSILDERFARGEIDAEEYEHRRRALERRRS